MCGIVGMINSSEFQRRDFPNMVKAINHRGPDADGVWYEDSVGVALGHARLSVIDVSNAGAQPMLSASGRYVLIYNGELYNHQKLRLMIQKDFGVENWRGESDTETLLVMIERLGIEASLNLINGMFAFAVWDRADKVMTIARDRIGEKPLYFGTVDGAAIFCSELHSVRANKALPLKIDEQAVSAFGQFGFIPAPHSIYDSVNKLPPGCIGSYAMSRKDWTVTRFWRTVELATENVKSQISCTDEQVLQKVESTLLDVVEQEMISDVPFGAFLSGGVDSSLVVSMMQKISSTPVATFTIGFKQQGFNEAEHAKQVASHLQTDHSELYIDDSDLLNIVPKMGTLFDEPFADESAIPLSLIHI